MKCPKCSGLLKPTLTRSSVVIDVCNGCRGVRLDQGEINFFAKDRKMLAAYSLSGLADAKEVLQPCPKCNVNMKAGKIPGFRYEVEECPSCHALWLDEHEFKKLADSGQFKSFAPDQRVSLDSQSAASQAAQSGRPSGAGRLRAPSVSLPNLGLTSTVVLGSMYAVLFGLVVFLVESGGLSSGVGLAVVVGFVLLQFLLGPILMDWSLRLFGSLTWVDYAQLPEHLRTFITETCARNRIPLQESD